MWRKRAIIWLIISITGIVLLIARLVQIQLVSTEQFSEHNINLLEASVLQRSQEVIIDNGRGNFLDRNGDPLNYQTKPVLILFPFLKKMNWNTERVASIIGASERELLAAVEDSKEPFAFREPDPLLLTDRQMEEINQLKIPGVFAVQRKYTILPNPAEQLIGIVRENPDLLKKRYPDKDLSQQTLLGLSGLEKSFDEFLLPEGKSKLVFHVDGDGGPLFGINVKYVEPGNPFYPINIKTTIDKDLQALAEKAVDNSAIKKGGIVLIDIESNSVAAMVSRPKINQRNPFNDDGITNMMVKQQIMGSVFKTVVAAAALDYNLVDSSRTFDCNKTITGEPDPNFHHGILNFNDSFARSCNNTFGTLAKDLKDIDPDILEAYAQKLSIIGPVGWKGDVYHLEQFQQLPDEDSGRIFLSEDAKKDSNFVALTGIGQHEARATPLAVANMMATIAKGGKKEMVRVASAVEFKNGTSMVDFDKKGLGGEALAPYTAMNLQKLLREVVLNERGTGRWLKDLPYEVAGKSGTAETGIFVDEKQLHNKWFAGYFPYKNPKYALVVINLDVFDNEGSIYPLYAEMVKGIYQFENEES